MARLLLIRHAPTPETGTRLTGRLPGVSLSEEGGRAARRAGKHLAPVPIRHVYTSPLERTRETAEAIAAPRRLTPVIHDGINEVDYGRWTGRTLASLRRTRLWRQVMVAPSRAAFPDGESLAAAQARAVAACEEIVAASGKSTVAIVSHADIIKAVLSHYLGQPLDLFQRIVISPTSVSVVDVPADGSVQVLAVNSAGDRVPWT